MKTSSHHEEHHTENHTGNYEDLLKLRSEKRAGAKKHIDTFLKDYEGEIVVMVRAKHLTDSEAEVSAMVVGTGDSAEQQSVLDGLKKVYEHCQKNFQQATPADELEAMLRALLNNRK